MTETAVYLQPAFILRHRKYRETSLIIDVLTRDFGRISLLAKGVRKAKSRNLGLLQPFIPLSLSFSGKAELKILIDAEIIHPYRELTGLALYCGFYVNELVALFLHQYDPHPEVFSHYRDCLMQLSADSAVEAVLRRFEFNLIDHVGYGLQLEHDYLTAKPVDPMKNYRFNSDLGPVEAADGQYSGKTLLAIKSREFNDPLVLSEAKILMRTVLDVYLQGKPLQSRAVINNLIRHTKNE
jgi:DNA repair protein RecO (recombination protein O)